MNQPSSPGKDGSARCTGSVNGIERLPDVGLHQASLREHLGAHYSGIEGDAAGKLQRFMESKTTALPNVIAMYGESGLLDRESPGPEGAFGWANVARHCLLEAGRAEQFANLIGLQADTSRDLVVAAALHDHYKKREKGIVSSEGLTWGAFEKANKESDAALRANGFSEMVIRIAGAVGHGSMEDIDLILKNPTFSEEDLAKLILHYIDDYTIGDQLILERPTEDVLGARMAANKANERYRQLDLDGIERFGMSTFDKQLEVGRRVEGTLCAIVSQRVAQTVSAKDLQLRVDEMLLAAV